jgi:hypothetical protein
MPALLTEYVHYAETRKSKNSTRKRNFKSKRARSLREETSDLWNDTKKPTTKSRETIPLKNYLFKKLKQDKGVICNKQKSEHFKTIL